MDRSGTSAPALPVWREPASGGLSLPHRALRWLFALPESLGVAIAVVAIFSLTILTFAAAYGAPLTLPRERMSIALGYSAVVPVAGAMVLYVALRLGRRLMRRSVRDEAPLLRLLATDLTLMGLFILATYFHFSFKTWVQVINPNLYDEQYFAVDQALRPVIDGLYWVRAHVLTAVPNTDAWYQAAYLLMFITGFCALAVTRHPVYPRFCVAVLIGTSLGALSYLPAPALGPFLYEEGANLRATEAQAGMLWAHQQVKQHGMAWIAEAGPAYFTGALAAMPSLHMSHALAMTWFIIQARSSLRSLFVIICLWVVVESVASRWHYLIDLPAGALLAALVIWLTTRLCPLESPRSHRPQTHLIKV